MKAYCKIGLTPTQRRFRYSLIAMWIGFTVILLGILLQVVDVDLLSKIGIRRLETNVTALVILSGAIIEVISAFFVWVYRTSIKQLNYFYNRQMYNHSVLMCQSGCGDSAIMSPLSALSSIRCPGNTFSFRSAFGYFNNTG